MTKGAPPADSGVSHGSTRTPSERMRREGSSASSHHVARIRQTATAGEILSNVRGVAADFRKPVNNEAN